MFTPLSPSFVINYQVPPFQILADNFTPLSVFDWYKGLSNTLREGLVKIPAGISKEVT